MSDHEHAASAASDANPKVDISAKVAIRAAAPKPRRLSRKTLLIASLALSGVVAFALVSGLSDRARRTGEDADNQQTLQTTNPPESIRERPANYDASQLAPPIEDGHDFLWGDHPPPGAHGASLSESAPAAPTTPAPTNSTQRDPTVAEADAARTSSILFGRNNRAAHSSLGSATPGASGPHGAFVNAEAGRDDGVLDATYAPPRSPYTVQAGSTISAALVTALNSDQPGRVTAQVSENVFDSVTGEHLLIPQGARLIGTYDAGTNYGDQRLLIVWNRLVMPNGWSVALRGMPGADATGAAGVHGNVDAHIGRIAIASLLSGALGVAANNSQDGDTSGLAQSVGDSAAQQAAQTGARLVDRDLTVRPTLRVAAGTRVRVFVSEDLILRPYPS